LAPSPWSGLDALERRVYTTLRSLMLHAPTAKLLAKGKAVKLTTALSAICHETIHAAAV
jgi:hypothetical protein